MNEASKQTLIGQAIGEASLCWEPKPKGVFDSTRAVQVGTQLASNLGLTFAQLRAANVARLPQFKNKHGEIAHSKPDGSDWSPAQWLGAVIGELGEYANIRKKFERGDMSFDEYEVLARKELADVQTYLDILAMRALDFDRPGGVPLRHVNAKGIDLGQATIDKFNEVSERVGSSVFIV